MTGSAPPAVATFRMHKVIHTKTFFCDDDHPIVYYTVDKENKAVCEYCYTKFLYEPKESIKQKEERTPSEKMQDKLEPIDDHVNKVLKGSG